MSDVKLDASEVSRRMVDRMIFFSDAVFAIALTLLVLELRPPEAPAGSEAEVMRGLEALAPRFIALLVSFALAGGWWLIHLAATRRLLRFDWPVALCNLLVLFWIALFPFAAAVFGANITSSSALGIYWVITAGAALSMTLMQLMMMRDGGRLVGGISGGERAGLLLMTLAPGITLSVCAWAAFNGKPLLAHFGWAFMLPAYVIAPMLMRMGRAKRTPAAKPPPARA